MVRWERMKSMGSESSEVHIPLMGVIQYTKWYLVDTLSKMTPNTSLSAFIFRMNGLIENQAPLSLNPSGF